MLYKYREAFSLRHEIGTCPNIEVKIEFADKFLFLIRPYWVREEDKTLIDKKMKWLCYMGILKEGFSAYSSPVMLIGRILTKDKRVVTDFRHLIVRIAKNNLVYPLVRDTFSESGRKFKEILWNTPIVWQDIVFISDNAYGTEHFPFYMAISYKHNSLLSPKQKMLWGKYGWSPTIHTM